MNKDYRCLRTFKTRENHTYLCGQYIGSFEFHTLTYEDQQNFSRVNADADENTQVLGNSLLDEVLMPSFDTSVQTDDSPSFDIGGSDSPSQDDTSFGGGDFGGGGASGDY